MGRITKKEKKNLLLTVGSFVFIFAISRIIGEFSTLLLGGIGAVLVFYALYQY